MKRFICIALVGILLSGCAYVSANAFRVSGDEIKGKIAGSPIDITGEDITITLYREMIFTLRNLNPEFSKTVNINDGKSKGSVMLGERKFQEE